MCMYCYNSSHCVSFPEIDNEEDCSQLSLCLSPDGDITENVLQVRMGNWNLSKQDYHDL
jgi:putative hemolysin